MGNKPLAGIKVVDMTTSYAGPYCSMVLADLGAEVIKVERTNGGDDSRFWGPPFIEGESAWFLSVNRNKKSISLNIREEQGREILIKLIRRADVFIQNLKPSSLGKYGLDYDSIRKIHPKLVYCSISGFGLTGPYKHLPGYDLIAQAMSGMMSVTGEEGGRPQRVGTSLSDITTGLIAALCTVSSLYGRNLTNSGRLVDVSLLETDVALMTPRIVSYLASGEEPKPSGGTDSAISIYQSLRTQDEDIVVCTGTQTLWKRFCEAIKRPEWVNDPKFCSNKQRIANRADLVAQVEQLFVKQPAEHWLYILQQAGVPCALIDGLSAVVENPQLLARNMITEVQHPKAGTVKIVDTPWKISGMGKETTHAPPMLGQHTAHVLADLGMSETEINQLHDKGVIYVGSYKETTN